MFSAIICQLCIQIEIIDPESQLTSAGINALNEQNITEHHFHFGDNNRIMICSNSMVNLDKTIVNSNNIKFKMAQHVN